MPTSKTQYLTPFKFFYKGMKVIIIKNLYPKRGIVNGTIGYVQNITFTKSHWIQYDELIHPLVNVFIDFNEVIQYHETLQDITLEGLSKNVILIAPIIKNFQYHHLVQESNTFKTFNISQYQLPFALAFYLIDFKVQGQTFERLIIDLCQPPNNVQLNMHNIYVTLSCLPSLNGFVILQNITIQDICKVNFKKGSLEMTFVLKSKTEQMKTPTCHNETNKCNMNFVKMKLTTLLKEMMIQMMSQLMMPYIIGMKNFN
jgi:hypothetical protein